MEIQICTRPNKVSAKLSYLPDVSTIRAISKPFDSTCLHSFLVDVEVVTVAFVVVVSVVVVVEIVVAVVVSSSFVV